MLPRCFGSFICTFAYSPIQNPEDLRVASIISTEIPWCFFSKDPWKHGHHFLRIFSVRDPGPVLQKTATSCPSRCVSAQQNGLRCWLVNWNLKKTTLGSTQVSFPILLYHDPASFGLWSPNDLRRNDPWKKFLPNWKCQGQQSLGDHQPGSVHAEEKKEGYEPEWRCLGMFICLLSLTNFIYPLPKNVINPSGDDCILGEIFTSHDFKSSKFVNSPNPKQHQFRQQIKQSPGEAFMSRRCCWIFSS